MSKIPSKSVIEDTKHAMAITALVLIASLVYGAASFPLVFNTNDDATMLGISLGLFSDRLGDPRLVYQSAFLGSMIGGLFRLEPNFDWYSATQCFFCLSAFPAIGFTLIRRDPGRLGTGSFIAAASIFCAPILFQIQFTQTSMLCVAASAVILLYTVSRLQWGRSVIFLALLFAVIAALVRPANLITAQLAFSSIVVWTGLYWLSKGEHRLALVRVARASSWHRIWCIRNVI